MLEIHFGQPTEEDTSSFETVGLPQGDPFSVVHLPVSKRDAMKFLPSEAQYLHLVDVSLPLSDWGSPNLTMTMDIDKVSTSKSLWSFTERGGILGNIAVRGFFGVLSTIQTVVVSGYEKIQYNGRPRQHIIWKNEHRLSFYAESQAN